MFVKQPAPVHGGIRVYVSTKLTWWTIEGCGGTRIKYANLEKGILLVVLDPLWLGVDRAPLEYQALALLLFVRLGGVLLVDLAHEVVENFVHVDLFPG